MAFVQQSLKQIHAKILILGPPASGKSRLIKSFEQCNSSQTNHPGLLEFRAQGPSFPVVYRFLPLSHGSICNHHLRLHFYAFDPQMPFAQLRSMLFYGVDALVYCLDASDTLQDSQLSFLSHCEDYLDMYQLARWELPTFYVYQERIDGASTAGQDQLDRTYNPKSLPSFDIRPSRGQNHLATKRALGFIAQRLCDKIKAGGSNYDTTPKSDTSGIPVDSLSTRHP